MPHNIVTHAYRPKRPMRKRKAVAIAGLAIVRKRNKADAVPPAPAEDHPSPANDDRRLQSPGARKAVIVITAKRKEAKLMRAEERIAEPDDPEADARVKSFFARMIRPP